MFEFNASPTTPQALHLAAYLDHNPEKLVQGKRVLELGAGTGVAGLAAAQLGA